MKKNFKLLVLVLLAFFAFSTGITKAYAAGEHEFSLRFYDCGEYDSDEEMCLGPNGDYVTPEISIDHGTVLPGQLIKMAVHYKPGDIPDNMFGAYVIYDIDLVNALHDSNDVLILNQTGTIYDEDNPGPYVPKGDTGKARLRTDWNVLFNDHIPTHTICTTVEDDTINQTKITTEGDLFYVYFTVNPNAEPGSEIVFEYDTNNATMMAHGGTITTSGAVLEVYEEQSDDNTLETLTVKNGSTTYALDPEFVAGSKTNKSFTTYVPANITSVDIDATAHEEHAIVSGTGTKSNLQYGNNSYDISVLSQSGQTEVYTVNVYRLNDDNTLSALSLSNVDFGTFSSDTTSYTATVPYTVDKTNVTATATAGNKATVTGTGNNKALSVGNTDIEVTVSPESCKSEYSTVPGNTCIIKTYTVTVTREAASENANAATLTVDGVSVPEFNKDTLVYTLDDVANNKTSVVIAATSEEEHATITGVGTRDLSVGDNALKVTITAQDGTTSKEYTINIHRKSNDATLSALTITSDPVGTLSPAFNSSTYEYTYSVDADEDSVTVSGTPNHALATVTESQTVNPRTTSSVTLLVTAEDGLFTQPYVVTFEVAKSSNANLSEITIDGEPITGFDPNTTTYDITVPSDKENVVVGATAQDDRSDVDGDGTIPLGYGENPVVITVTAEDGTEKEYTINVTREKKHDADLLDLQVDDVSVPGFDKDTLVYDLGEVASNKEGIKLAAILNDSYASVTGDGTKNLLVGDNTFDIIVTAQDGTTKKTYTVKVRRLNDSKNLESLTITSDPVGTLEPTFDPGTTTYTYTTDPDETEVIINATVPAGSGSTITEGPGTYNPATTSEVTIVVKAEDNTEKRYVINLVRGESSNNNLSDITIDETTIDGFDPNVTTYNITVPSDKDKVNIGTTLADNRAEVTGDGEKDLTYGNNPIAITVTAENGTPKVYYVNITRELKNNANLSDLTADDVTVPGFDPETLVYDLGEVASDKTSIKIGATLADTDARVTGTGTFDVAVGANEYKVTVTAQDTTTKKEYTIKLYKPNSDSSLTGIEVQADTTGTLSPAFDPATTEYTYTSDPDEDEVTIVVTPADGANAVIVGHPDGKVNPADGEDVEVIVTAEDGTITTYTIHVERGLSTNNYLENLEVTGYTINPAFDKDTDHYTLTVDADVDKVTIVATKEDDRATVTGDGEKDLTFGSNPFTITVKAENGDEKPYYLTIERELSDDVKLSDLKVDGDTITGFDPDVSSYDYGTIPNDKTSLEVTGTSEDPNATVEVTGNDNLQVGENTIIVTVKAQDGTEGTYTITVTREADSNNDLKSLEVEGYTLDPEFNKDTTNYAIEVPKDVDSIVVNAEPESDYATVTVEGADNLQPGENTVTVTVKAEDGTEKVYTITVTKEEEPEEDEKITSSIRTIADGFIKDVVYKSLPEQLKDECDNENWKLHIFADEEEVSEDQKLGTGMVIKLIKDDRVHDSDILVIKGEITGDGLVKVGDVVAVVNNYLDAEENPLEGAFFLAADMDDSGTIRVGDVVAIVNIYLED